MIKLSGTLSGVGDCLGGIGGMVWGTKTGSLICWVNNDS